MSYNYATTFTVLALPVMVAAAPAFADACKNDPMGFSDRLQHIEIDSPSLTGSDYKSIIPYIRKGIKDASRSVIDDVTTNFLGTEFMQDGIPPYPAYQDAKDAFICAMEKAISARSIHGDQKIIQSALESGLIELMLLTAITEDDISQRAALMNTLGEAGTLGPLSNLQGYAEQMFDEVMDHADLITVDPERLDGFVSFSYNTLKDPESPYHRPKLARILGKLVIHDIDHVPKYLDIIDEDDKLFYTTYSAFIRALETREFDERIFQILQDKLENQELEILPRYVIQKMSDLAKLNPDLQDRTHQIFTDMTQNPQTAYHEAAFRQMSFNTSRILQQDDRDAKLEILDFWDEVFNPNESPNIESHLLNTLTNTLAKHIEIQDQEIRERMSNIARILQQGGADYRADLAFYTQEHDRHTIQLE